MPNHDLTAWEDARDERTELDFLRDHQGADEIVVDADTGVPVKAVYRTLRGVPRRYPVEYPLMRRDVD
jgi:hypothetical protein